MLEPVTSSSSSGSMKPDLCENEFENIIKNIKKENIVEVSDENSDWEEVHEIKRKHNHGTPETNHHIIKKIKIVSDFNEHTKLRNNKIVGVNQSKKFKSSQIAVSNKMNAAHLENNDQKESAMMSNENISPHLKTIHKCKDSCLWCMRPFAVFDNPNHICRIRNVEKQNSFLEIVPQLNIESCLCDRCWKYLEKKYKEKQFEKRKGCNDEVGNNSINTAEVNDVNGAVKIVKLHPYKKSKYIKRRKRRRRCLRIDVTCSVHNCSEYSIHPISEEKYAKIKMVLSNFVSCDLVLIESSKMKTNVKDNSNSPVSVCEDHLHLLDTIISCQLCGELLSEDLNSEDWEIYDVWNKKLMNDKIPLKLCPGMFICMKCRQYVSDGNTLCVHLTSILQNIKKRENARLRLFGLTDKCDLEINNTLKKNPIIKASANRINVSNMAKVTFTEPEITSTFLFKSEDLSDTLGKIDEEYTKQLVKLLPNSYDNDINNLRYFNCTNLNDSNLELKQEFNEKSHDCNDQADTPDLIEVSPQIEHCKNDSFNLVISNAISLADISSVNYSEQSNINKTYNSKPNIRVVKLMELVKKDINAISESTLLDSSISRPTSPDDDCTIVLNDTFNIPSEVTFAANKNIIPPNNDNGNMSISNCALRRFSPDHNITLKDLLNKPCEESFPSDKNIAPSIDVEKDLLPLHVCNLLDNDDYSFSNEEQTSKYEPVITSVYSQQDLPNRNKQFEDNSTRNENQCINYEEMPISKTFSSKRTNQKSKTLHLEKRAAKADPVEIRKKLQHLLRQRISKNKGIKRLNNVPTYNDRSMSKDSSTQVYSSSFKMIENNACLRANDKKINNSQKTVIPTIVSSFSARDKIMPSVFDEYFESEEQTMNIDSDSNDAQQCSAYDEETLCQNDQYIHEFIVEDPNLKKSDSSEKLHNSILPVPKSLKFMRKLKKVSDFTPLHNKKVFDQFVDDNYSSDDEIDSLEDNKCPEYDSEPESNAVKRLKVISRTFAFPQNTSSISTTAVTNIKPPTVKPVKTTQTTNTKKEVRFFLNESNKKIFNDLLVRFKSESDVFRYLMENERMLYAGELDISKNANPQVAKYLNSHLNFLKNWFSNPVHGEDSLPKRQTAKKIETVRISSVQRPVHKTISITSTATSLPNVANIVGPVRKNTFSPKSVLPFVVSSKQPITIRPRQPTLSLSSLQQSISPNILIRPIQLPSPRPVAIRSGTSYVLTKPSTVRVHQPFANQQIRNILDLGTGRKYMIVKKSVV
ncbi:uncharacterized protein LOC126834802 [Adelges cooleyi]|uniref:uncharacterized protein LOC126834802 n=1 Tax=Adelges cooleyi TaxID=133065 RepID=UPI0021808227|nr:uncharacterized protein LOC126834802 [Adelges cooleyi]